MANGFPITGISPTDPNPGTVRDLLVAQNTSGTGGGSDDVLIYGNKTSDGSESTNTIGTPILDLADCIARFGKKSEITWEYRAFAAIPQQATVYAVAVPESGSGTAASIDWTIATTATGSTNLVVEWGGYQLFVPVASGDTPTTQAAAVVAAVVDWEEGAMPFTASNSSGAITFESSNLGPRADLVINRIRMYYQKSVASTVGAGSLTSGTNDDDFTTAYAAAANSVYAYQINPKHTTSSPSATDNGVGEGAAYITTQVAPVNGKEQQMFFGLVGTSSQAVTVATTVNNAWCQFFWAENSPWTPGMIAAHWCAIVRAAQIVHPCANLTGYTAGDNRICLHPRPYSTDDYPTTTELTTALNNGISPIKFDRLGKAVLHRQVTSRSLNGSSNDYRCREGHIPNGLRFFWQEVARRWEAMKQPFVTDDWAEGQKPVPGFTTPGAVKAMVQDTMRDMVKPFIGNSAVLDPGSLDAMLSSVEALKINGGVSVKANPIVVMHLLKGQFQIGESSPAY